jgi:hypothetical protein
MMRAFKEHAMSSKPYITVERLFAAADALLEAMSSPDGMNALIDMSFRPQGCPEPGDSPFSEAELVEAMAMLIRMGLAGPAAAAE